MLLIVTLLKYGQDIIKNKRNGIGHIAIFVMTADVPPISAQKAPFKNNLRKLTAVLPTSTAIS